MPEPTYDEPSNVTADEGAVHVDGPDGVAVSLTPDAAAETSDRLLSAAAHAHGQKINAENQDKRPTSPPGS